MQVVCGTAGGRVVGVLLGVAGSDVGGALDVAGSEVGGEVTVTLVVGVSVGVDVGAVTTPDDAVGPVCGRPDDVHPARDARTATASATRPDLATQRLALRSLTTQPRCARLVGGAGP